LENGEEDARSGMGKEKSELAFQTLVDRMWVLGDIGESELQSTPLKAVRPEAGGIHRLSDETAWRSHRWDEQEKHAGCPSDPRRKRGVDGTQ